MEVLLQPVAILKQSHWDHLLNQVSAIPFHHSKSFICKTCINFPVLTQLAVNVQVIVGAVYHFIALKEA
jgi:hypothetical protein